MNAGQAHAEVNAHKQVKRRARAYYTLELLPSGQDAPCTDAILGRASRVIAAMLDPFPKVAGQGLARLRAAGLEVESGLCEAEAQLLNAPYLKLLATGQPYVHAKWAMTLDGKIATARHDSKWISNETSRVIHDPADACRILVGANSGGRMTCC